MKLFSILLISIILLSCSSDNNDLPFEIETLEEEVEIIEKKTSYSDTLNSYYGVGEYYSFDTYSEDTLLSIDGNEYRLFFESRLNSTIHIIQKECYSEDDTIKCYSQTGYQAFYTFSLFQEDKTVFEIELTKEDLKKAEYDLIVISGAQIPELVEFNEKFNAFIFEIPFNAEGTCWASNALLLIGLDGEVKLVDRLSGSGGNYTNHNVQITSNGENLISSSAIHYKNGSSHSFNKKDKELMGVDILDESLLVVYEFDSTTHQKNAYITDYSGKTLLNFKYEGWTGALGYQFLHKKVKDAYYFIDEPNFRLIELRKMNGSWNRLNLPFSSMIEYDGNQNINDQMVNLNVETMKFTFYIDTINGEIRKLSSEEF